MIRAASRLKHGAILNFKSERAAVLNFKRTADLNSEPECAPALNFKSEQNAPVNFTAKQSPVLNFNRAPLNFRSRCDEFYRAFLARGSCGTAILSDKILSSRGQNFKACGKRDGVKFLKFAPKFAGEQKEGCDAKHR
ncbi:MAG: hypothetical protein KH703_04000 [Campylobacter gracilis]|uniref:hypothetical protein n=1 Tax=Campylobacter gracilis TaxID=824 RepID=UPI0026F0BC7B|nr:hypothetical protein [Campylobacter gracilis]MBS6152561.1 hypothetical protein [Campylobacter gracilis]